MWVIFIKVSRTSTLVSFFFLKKKYFYSIRMSGLPEKYKKEGKNFSIEYVKGQVPHLIIIRNGKKELTDIGTWSSDKIQQYIEEIF
jgi:hypothetical protein